jgi:hypothetical protein
MICRHFILPRKINLYSRLQFQALRLAVQAESASASVCQVDRSLAFSISAAFVHDTPISR